MKNFGKYFSVIGLIVFITALLMLGSTLKVAAVEGEVNYTGINTTLTGDDSFNGPVNLGFTFNFYGTDYTSAYVNINGTLNFGAGFAQYSNGPLSSSGDNNSIYAFWDDLITQSGKQSIYYATIGEPGSRQFIVQWTNMYFYSNPTLPMGTFQVILYEGSNKVQIQYRDLLGGTASQGSSATIGIKKDATYLSQYSNGTASLTQEQAISYVPIDSNSFTVNAADTYDPVYLLPDDVPAGPTLINPLDGSTDTTVTPTFEWQPVSLATSYRLLVSTVANFSSTVINQSGITATNYTLGSALNYNTNYYWRVEAINNNGSSFSSSRHFITAATPNATPDVPANVTSDDLANAARIGLSKKDAANLSIGLSDSDDGEQLRFRIQIATENTFASPIIDYRSTFDDAGTRTYQFSDNSGTYLTGSDSVTFDDDQDYFIRVRAEDDGSASSNWYSVPDVAFTYDLTAPTQPAKPIQSTTPLNGNVKISWATTDDLYPSSTATYILERSTVPDFSTSQTYSTNALYLNMTGLDMDSYHYFRLTVVDSAGNISSSSDVLTVFMPAVIVPITPPVPKPTPAPEPEVIAEPIVTPIEETTPTPEPVVTQTEPEVLSIVKIFVVDDNGNPIVGAKVTLHSTPMVAYSDKDGIATFYDVEVGDHTVIVENQGETKTESLTLKNEVADSTTSTSSTDSENTVVQEAKITIAFPKTVSTITSPKTDNFFWYYIGAVALVFAFFIIVLIKRRKKHQQ